MTAALSIAGLAGVCGPYRGVLVLEIGGNEPSGAFGAQILADLGATVLKVERVPKEEPHPFEPPKGDETLRPDVAFFAGLNRNKRSVCLDLKSQEGREILLKLARHADVVYDNYRPGVTRRLGIDQESLSALNPDIICCSVTGYGHTGPRSHLAAFDVVVQAQGGGMSITGRDEPGSMPVRWSNPIAGIGGALYAVVGILAALRRRGKAGGAFVDISMLDAQLAMHSYRVPAAMDGHTYGPQHRRGGSGSLPYGPFLAGDGRWFVIGITQQFWATMCRILDHPEWIDDPRYRTEKDRQNHEEEVNRMVSEAMLARSADEWQELFVKGGIPGGKVLTIEEAFEHPHVAIRNMLVGFTEERLGPTIRVAGNPLKMSQHPFAGFRAPPGLGEDTELVLRTLLDVPVEERQRLKDAKAVWWPEHGLIYERQSHV